jgi:hypothetical protein
LRLKRIVFNLIITFMIVLAVALPVFAISNPNSISFGNDDLYQVFYNVKQTGDWLVMAEGYVYYNLATYENLAVTGAGIETNLTPSAGANWQCVSDGSDLTYISTNSTSYITDLYELANSTVGTGYISSVTLYYRIMNASTYTTYGVPIFYINGNYYNGSSQTATTGWATKSEVFTTNPATSDVWTWNDIDNMQIGISLLTSNVAGRARCSAVYAVVNYILNNPGYDASEAFSFELLNTAGNVTLASVPLQSYGDRPTSIYLTASQVTTLGLTTGTSYGIRIIGNPLVFLSPVGNNVTAYLAPDDYTDQELGDDGGVPTDNNLRNFCLKIAENMEMEDNLADIYIAMVQGYSYLTSVGGNLFIEGVPNLNQMCPILFQSGVQPMTGDTPSDNGTYAGMLTPLNQWGATTANGLTSLGTFLGINQALAGSLVLFLLSAMLAFWFYQKTQSGIAVILLVGTTPFLGAWLGLMPLALAFIFTIIVIVLMAYYFFSRGAL